MWPRKPLKCNFQDLKIVRWWILFLWLYVKQGSFELHLNLFCCDIVTWVDWACGEEDAFEAKHVSYCFLFRSTSKDESFWERMCFIGSSGWNRKVQYCAKVMRVNFDEFRALFSSKYRRTFDRYFAASARQLNEISTTIRQGKRKIKSKNRFEFSNQRNIKENSLQIKCNIRQLSDCKINAW